MLDKTRCRRKWQEDSGESKIDDEKYASKVMKCFPELHSRHSRRDAVLSPRPRSTSTGAVVETSLEGAEIEKYREIRNARGLNLI